MMKIASIGFIIKASEEIVFFADSSNTFVV